MHTRFTHFAPAALLAAMANAHAYTHPTPTHTHATSAARNSHMQGFRRTRPGCALHCLCPIAAGWRPPGRAPDMRGWRCTSAFSGARPAIRDDDRSPHSARQRVGGPHKIELYEGLTTTPNATINGVIALLTCPKASSHLPYGYYGEELTSFSEWRKSELSLLCILCA